MSLVINTNFAATTAANNLAASNQALQRSLNRLSSGSKIVNPSDDAGGLAVSMKLASAAKRQGAALTNIGNGVSYLQTQEGAMKAVGKVLDRIGELKTLALDPTKNASDVANYNVEFTQLKAQLTSLGAEKFNGISLFGSSTLDVRTTEDGNTTVAIGGADLLGSAAFSPFSDTFDDPDMTNWSWSTFGGIGASVSAPSGKMVFNTGGGEADATSVSSFSGAFELTLDFQKTGAFTPEFSVDFGATRAFSYLALNGDTGPHSLRLAFDGASTLTAYVDGSSTAYSTATAGATSGALTLRGFGSLGTFEVDNLSMTSTGASGGVSGVTGASSLSALSLSAITTAVQNVATFRATNGAQHSRLDFAAEVLTTNKANLEAATSRIVDVDVAEESTQLARYNILVQAGTSMLSQANQSSQAALKLLG
jgi:flagellin-like hook-associated protein FlgL